MKTAILYYSYSGFTRKLAETMAAAVDADLIELKLKEELLKKNQVLISIIKGGAQAILKAKPELLNTDFALENYDLVIIGTPVWAWTFSPPLRTFFESYKLAKQKIALFATHHGKPGNVLSNMEAELPDAEIVAKREFLNDVDKANRSVSNSKLWIKSFVK